MQLSSAEMQMPSLQWKHAYKSLGTTPFSNNSNSNGEAIRLLTFGGTLLASLTIKPS
jgi:hypothetical protein